MNDRTFSSEGHRYRNVSDAMKHIEAKLERCGIIKYVIHVYHSDHNKDQIVVSFDAERLAMDAFCEKWT